MFNFLGGGGHAPIAFLGSHPDVVDELSVQQGVFVVFSGRDPLAGLNHWKDINAVAGVLRCYFRELQDPLFPRAYYQEFIDTSSES